VDHKSSALRGRPAAASARRRFLRLAAAGAVVVAGGTAATASTRGAVAAGTADALLLNCIDFRLINEVNEFMNGQGLKHEYDQVILAGGALAALTDAYPAWNTTFWQHLDLAIQLHAIHEVIVIDHRDCGAYKLVLGEDFALNPARETEVHSIWLQALRDAITATYPDLSVALYLMALDGTVQTID